jgi:DNA invertase Pin-like site-specific DNA recombinase
MSNSPFKAGSRVVTYLRHSPGDQQSIDSQEHAVRQWCAQEGLALHRLYKDEARSGTTLVGRDSFLQMMTDLQGKDGTSGVVLWSLSRFGRDYDEADYHMALLRKRGYDIYSMTDDVPTGRFGRVMEAVHLWKAEEDSVRIGKDAQRGLRWLAEQGFAAGGFPPHGYKKSEPVEVGKRKNGTTRLAYRWEIDSEQEIFVRQAWRMKLEGHNNWDIHHATKLFKSLNCWTHFFDNETYTGTRLCGDLKVPGAHPAYVSRADFDRVRAVKKPARIRGGEWSETQHPMRQKSDSPYYLSGLLRCGYCGAAMVGSNGPDQTYYYRCGNRQRQGQEVCVQKSIVAHHLHSVLFDWIAHEIYCFENLVKWRDELDESLSRYKGDFVTERLALMRKQGTLRKKIANLLNLYENNPSQDASDRLTLRRQEMASLQADIERVRGLIQVKPTPLSDLELRAASEAFAELLAGSERPLIRQGVKTVIAGAELYSDRMIVQYFPPICVSKSMPPREGGDLIGATQASHSGPRRAGCSPGILRAPNL